MRIFVYEYTCCGGAAGHDPAPSLRAEGWAMLAALLEDLDRIPGIQPLTILDHACPWRPAGEIAGRVRAGEEETLFRSLARACDSTLVIAPEFDDLLYTRCRWVETSGGQLLGPPSATVRLAADKLELGRHLSRHGVSTPPCHLLPASATFLFPAVCKPRHGAGSQATFLVNDAAGLEACTAQARAEGWGGELILQPFVEGQPVSATFLMGRQACVELPAGRQELSADGRFRYQGGSLPLAPDLGGRALKLARRAVAAVPGLQGYVGVDLVLGNAEDGSQDQVIEINPRPTTSYVGLRALTRTNLAEVLLCLASGREFTPPLWKPGTVCFRADGTVLNPQCV